MYRLNMNPILSDLKPMASVFDHFLQNGLSNVVGNGLAMSSPQVNIREEDNSWFVDLAAPGRKKEAFELTINKDVLTVTLNKEEERKEDEEFVSREFNYQSFTKSFQLNEGADQSKINATYNAGVLTIEIPKLAGKATEEKHKIEIK